MPGRRKAGKRERMLEGKEDMKEDGEGTPVRKRTCLVRRSRPLKCPRDNGLSPQTRRTQDILSIPLRLQAFAQIDPAAATLAGSQRVKGM